MTSPAQRPLLPSGTSATGSTSVTRVWDVRDGEGTKLFEEDLVVHPKANANVDMVHLCIAVDELAFSKQSGSSGGSHIVATVWEGKRIVQ